MRIGIGLGVSLSVFGCVAGARYSDGAPPPALTTGCLVASATVVVSSDAESSTYVAPRDTLPSSLRSPPAFQLNGGVVNYKDPIPATYPDFAARVAPVLELGDARRVGDLRTQTVIVSPQIYELARCRWIRTSDAACRDRGVVDRLAASLLGDLRSKAAAAGADRVHGVRCFGESRGTQLRIWCEGTAYSARCALPTAVAQE
jgi:hypothetical protein